MTPHLIHVGFAKAGSTFLQEWFDRHPEIAYGKGGFGGYATVWSLAEQAFVPREIKLRATSAEQFSAPVRSVAGLISDFADHIDMAAVQDTVSASLADMFPDAHILIVTRGPRSSFPSGLSQLVRNGSAVRMSHYVAHLRDRPGGIPVDYLVNFDRFVALYRERFGGRVIVLPYELLRDDRETFLSHIERRFGLNPFRPELPRVNPSLEPAELRWYPLMSSVIRRLPVGGAARRRLLRLHVRAIARGWTRPLARVLDRVLGRRGRPSGTIPEVVFDDTHVTADALMREPYFAPYASEYLVAAPATRQHPSGKDATCGTTR